LQVQLSIQSSCDTVLTTSPCHFPWEIPLSDDQPLSIGAPFGTPHLAFEIDTCQHRAAHEIDQQRLETWQSTRAKRAIHQGKWEERPVSMDWFKGTFAGKPHI